MQLENEEWNKRLIEYIEKIERKEYEKIDFNQFFRDVFEFRDYKSHFSKNSNKEKIIEYIKTNIQLQEVIAKHFNCKVDEICFEKLNSLNYDGKIKIVLSKANFNDSIKYDLSSLQSIGGDADFSQSQVTDLSSLESIGGNANFIKSKVTDLSSLQSIGGGAYFRNTKEIDLSSLQSIGGRAYFYNSQVTDLSSLQSIDGDADFRQSQVTNLRSLQSIGGDANFINSKVTDLSNLQSIGGRADFRGSKVNNLSSLKEVKGNVYLDDWQAELFGDMFIKEGNHYRFVPESERGSFAEMH